ncbi:hypothetical protein ACPZ19_21325 [Amycolatopsis lurida]
MPETIEELAAHLVERGLATAETLEPCTPEEVAQVREAQGVEALPPVYEEFLLRMGRRAGDLLRGTSVFYPGIVELADEMRDLLRENKVEHLVVPGSILLGMHQGYQLYWLEPGGQVHQYEEMETEIMESWPSLLGFLSDETDRHLELRRRYPR